MKRNLARRGVRAALALALTVLLCVAMNYAAFLIDTDAMRENAAQGVALLGQEGGTPQLVAGFRSSQLDNFTAILILKTAAYAGPETLTQKAFGGLRVELAPREGQSEWSAFATYAQSEGGGLTYTRYWHGYTLPLRLLLCVLNLPNLQMALLLVSLLLAFAVLAGCARRAPGALPGMIAGWFLLMPVACGVCLQYVPVTLLALGACLLLLHADDRVERAVGMPGLFALLGLLTNYFDLLTFPLVTLGFPMALLLCLRMERGEGLRALLSATVACGMAWALGYAGMWMLKWAFVAGVFGADRLAGIFEQAALRVSSASNGEAFSRLSALRLNLGIILDKAAYLLVLLLALAASLALALRRALASRRSGRGVRLQPGALALALLCAVPVLWCLAMANHAYDHAFFTYRNLTVSFLAALCACGYATGDKRPCRAQGSESIHSGGVRS